MANLVFAPTFRLCGRGQREFQIADLQGILVIAQGRVIRRRWNAEAGRQPRIHQARPLQFLEARKVAQRLQAELRQEGFRSTECQRPARRLQASAWQASLGRAARWRRTTVLPEAAIPRAALVDPQHAPRHRLCVFPPGLPWRGLLLPLTRPANPARSSGRMLVAADAFENTAARTPPSCAAPPRLP